MLKQFHKRYTNSTPVLWRKIGDTLLLVGSTITTYAILEGDKVFAVISLVCTVLGKIITNLTQDAPKQDSEVLPK
jgi:hypothetical protein